MYSWGVLSVFTLLCNKVTCKIRKWCKIILVIVCVWLFAVPSGSSVHGIFRARVLKWAVISYSRGSSQPRHWTCLSESPALAGGFFTTSATWEALRNSKQKIFPDSVFKATASHPHGGLPSNFSRLFGSWAPDAEPRIHLLRVSLPPFLTTSRMFLTRNRVTFPESPSSWWVEKTFAKMHMVSQPHHCFLFKDVFALIAALKSCLLKESEESVWNLSSTRLSLETRFCVFFGLFLITILFWFELYRFVKIFLTQGSEAERLAFQFDAASYWTCVCDDWASSLLLVQCPDSFPITVGCARPPCVTKVAPGLRGWSIMGSHGREVQSSWQGGWGFYEKLCLAWKSSIKVTFGDH